MKPKLTLSIIWIALGLLFLISPEIKLTGNDIAAIYSFVIANIWMASIDR